MTGWKKEDGPSPLLRNWPKITGGRYATHFLFAQCLLCGPHFFCRHLNKLGITSRSHCNYEEYVITCEKNKHGEVWLNPNEEGLWAWAHCNDPRTWTHRAALWTDFEWLFAHNSNCYFFFLHFFFFEFQFWIPNHSCLHNIRGWTLIRSKPPLWPTHISARAKTKRKYTLWRPSVRSGLWVQAKLWSIPPPASHVSSQRLQINSKLWTSLSVLNINKQLDQLSPLTLSELDQFESWFLA